MNCCGRKQGLEVVEESSKARICFRDSSADLVGTQLPIPPLKVSLVGGRYFRLVIISDVLWITLLGDENKDVHVQYTTTNV